MAVGISTYPDKRKSLPEGRLVYRALMAGIALGIGVYAAQELAWMAGSPWAQQFAFANGDIAGYLDGTRRFLVTGSPYETGVLTLSAHSFIHPPIALALFLPFLWLPSILWWAIPIVGTAYLVVRSRPAPWTWPLIALALLWPRSQGAILAGNSDLWVMFVVALGVRFGWPIVGLILKPTFAPLGLLWLRDRRTRIAALGIGLAMLPLLPLWLQWFSVVRQIDGGLAYSIGSLPLVLLPTVAWSSSRSSSA